MRTLAEQVAFGYAKSCDEQDVFAVYSLCGRPLIVQIKMFCAVISIIKKTKRM